MSKYQPTIGLEIHAQLKTNTKMFCDCLNNPEVPTEIGKEKPNFNICPICTGHPGVLPVINQEAVNQVIKTGLALNCKITKDTWFERKNYFYPDLPKNYQISQKAAPLCQNGELRINNHIIKIHEIHLEEDTGRLIHSKKDVSSLVDFNRAGIPLMELVTEPDITSAIEAKRFCEELRLILRYLEVSNADMEKGEMRCEANISLSQKSKVKNQKLGTKVEIKNLNSFKAVERAIDYEIKRQAAALDNKEKIIQETRGWNEKKQKTFSQRTKETSEDYRYFTEPDLPPLKISTNNIEKIRSEVPELPNDKRKRFEEEYKIPKSDIEIFTTYKPLGDYFENVISELKNWQKTISLKNKNSKSFYKLVKLTANYLITELKKQFDSLENINSLKITPENFAEFIILVSQNKISSSAAQVVLKKMFSTGADPSQIIEEQDLTQMSDESELEKIILSVIKNNPQPVKDYKKGNKNALQFLVGQVMKLSQGKANPKIAAELLNKNL